MKFHVIIFITFPIFSFPALGGENSRGKNINVNEAVMKSVLSTFAYAQGEYKRQNFSAANKKPAKNFATSFTELGGKNANIDNAGQPLTLIPAAMANASKENPFFGYYFANKQFKNKMVNSGLWAIPAKYGITGKNTFYISAYGDSYQKDTGGVPPTQEPDDSWQELPLRVVPLLCDEGSTLHIYKNEMAMKLWLPKYVFGQNMYYKMQFGLSNGLGKKSFAKSFSHLGGKNSHKSPKGGKAKFIPDAMADATKETPFGGFRNEMRHRDCSSRTHTKQNLMRCQKSQALSRAMI